MFSSYCFILKCFIINEAVYLKVRPRWRWGSSPVWDCPVFPHKALSHLSGLFPGPEWHQSPDYRRHLWAEPAPHKQTCTNEDEEENLDLRRPLESSFITCCQRTAYLSGQIRKVRNIHLLTLSGEVLVKVVGRAFGIKDGGFVLLQKQSREAKLDRPDWDDAPVCSTTRRGDEGMLSAQPP